MHWAKALKLAAKALKLAAKATVALQIPSIDDVTDLIKDPDEGDKEGEPHPAGRARRSIGAFANRIPAPPAAPRGPP